jgi:hypothetical protein
MGTICSEVSILHPDSLRRVRFALWTINASAYLHIIAQIAPFASISLYFFGPPDEKPRLALKGAGA